MNTALPGIVDIDDPVSRGRSPVDVAVWTVWTVTLIVVMGSHEMWRDELQAWAIARDSTWPWELIDNTAYEGHPPGWHLVLWAPSVFTRSPVAAQFVNLICVSAAGWLVLRYFPFSRPVRVLLLFGYFPLFEMGAIARSYSLLFLLVAGVLVLADRRPLPLAATVTLLGAMAATHVLAIPLVGALAVALALGHPELSRRRRLMAGGVLVTMILVSLQLARPPQRDGRRVAVDAADVDRIRHVLTAPIRVVLPIFEHHGGFWGRFVSHGLGDDERWFGLLVLLVGVAILRRRTAALAVWTIGTTGYLGATHVFGLPMEPRQLTILWLTLLAAVWMAGSEEVRRRTTSPPSVESTDTAATVPERARPGRAAGWAVRSLGAAALVVGVAGAVWPIGTDLRHPFSGAEGAAEWVREQGESPVAIYCATARPACSSVAIRLDEPAYSSSDGDPFSFVVWRSGWRRRTAPELLAEDSRLLEERLGRRVVVVASLRDFPPGCDLGWVAPPTIEPAERLIVCFADQLTGQRAG
jgi:hypothetical protein